MRFSAVIVSALVAAFSVNAQTNSTATTSSAIVSGTAITPAQASQAACLKTCNADDVTCRSLCIAIGNTVNPTNDCVKACPKGTGTPADNLVYQNCVQACIITASAQPTALEPTTLATYVAPTSGVASATSTGAATGTGTGTSTAASASATKNASDNLRIGGPVVGLLAAFAAILML